MRDLLWVWRGTLVAVLAALVFVGARVAHGPYYWHWIAALIAGTTFLFTVRYILYMIYTGRVRRQFMDSRSTFLKEAMRRNPELAARMVGGEFHGSKQ